MSKKTCFSKLLVAFVLMACLVLAIGVAPGWANDEDQNAARAALLRGDYQQAVDLFTLAIDNSRSDEICMSFLYLERSMAYEKLKEYRAAIDDMRTFVAIHPEDPRGQVRLEALQSKL